MRRRSLAGQRAQRSMAVKEKAGAGTGGSSALYGKIRASYLQPEGCGKEFRTHVDTLLELDPDHSAWMLLNAWVMGLENRQEEAGWILRKYEKTRLFQQRDVRTKELYLYVNSIYRKGQSGDGTGGSPASETLPEIPGRLDAHIFSAEAGSGTVKRQENPLSDPGASVSDGYQAPSSVSGSMESVE